MDKLIDDIRNAIESGASAEVRANGAHACRTILAALEANAGESLVQTPGAPTTPLHAIVGVLRTMPPDQLLDLAIAKLKAAVPPEASIPSVPFVRFPIVPVANVGGSHGRR